MYGNHYLLKRLCYICFDLKCYWLFLVAAAGMAIAGAVQAGIGVSERNKARKEQEAQYRKLLDVAAKKADYAAKLDKEWSDSFGDTTKQVAEYYSNLTGDSLRQQYDLAGNQANMQSYQNYQNQLKQLDTKMNQMGMQNSSQALSALMQMSSQQMANNAAINFETQMNKMQSDQQVAQQKLAYNQTGNWLKEAAINTKNQSIDMEYQAEQTLMGVQQQREQSANDMISSGINAMSNSMSTAVSGWQGMQANKTQLQTAQITGRNQLMNQQLGKYQADGLDFSSAFKGAKADVNLVYGGIK